MGGCAMTMRVFLNQKSIVTTMCPEIRFDQVDPA